MNCAVFENTEASGFYRVTVYRYSAVDIINDRDYIMLTITTH